VQLPPGRTQIISDIPSNVIIDYAHNAEGFDFFLSSIKDSYEKLVIIFGCGGERDKDKRPEMLATAIQYGDKIIFTSDNSRNEKFKDIFNDASEGNDIKDVLMIEDRKEAIIDGAKLINKNDCLVILGKGHEQTQEINGKTFHFSDHEVVNEIYK
jgi:UDP-N-acetylmuramyl tripeptide synthase